MASDHNELIKLNSVMIKLRNDSLDAIESDTDDHTYYRGVYDTSTIVLHHIDEYLFSNHDSLINYLLGDPVD